jgi:probable biosynthetic protein (TIGR04098 family)
MRLVARTAEAGPRVWDRFEFSVGMPHMVPDKLSEVELLKLLGAWQWDSIARLLGCRSSEIAAESGERLYASFINIELNLGAEGQDAFSEGDLVTGANSIAVYANRFVEGLLVFDKGELPASLVAGVKGPDDLRELERPWAYMTNAFVARMGSNAKLKVFEPAGLATRPVERVVEAPPVGIGDQQSVHSTGAITGFGDADGAVMPAERGDPIVYPIMPESDLNGAGLLYFARYVAIMNYAERVWLSGRLLEPWSQPLIACLSTERRRLYYFTNADASDSVRAAVSVSALPARPAPHGPRASLMKLLFRIDLYRASDGVLMASSLVRKALSVPASDKGLAAEGARLLRSQRPR